MPNSNYQTYIGTALQRQRWRDFIAHLTAYLLINATLITIWLAIGRGAFWPGISLLGWALGLSSQHFLNLRRGPITDCLLAWRHWYHMSYHSEESWLSQHLRPARTCFR